MCWVHTLLQDGEGATSDFGEVGSDGGQRWDEVGHANWSSRNTTTRPTRPCSTRWSTPTTSGTTRRSRSRATAPPAASPCRHRRLRHRRSRNRSADQPIHRQQCDAAAPTSPATTADVDTAAPTSATTAAASATTAAAGDDRGSGCGCSGSSGGLQLDLIMTNRTLFGGDEPAHLTVTNRSQGRWPERWSSATPTPPSAPGCVGSTPTHLHPTGRDGLPGRWSCAARRGSYTRRVGLRRLMSSGRSGSRMASGPIGPVEGQDELVGAAGVEGFEEELAVEADGVRVVVFEHVDSLVGE